MQLFSNGYGLGASDVKRISLEQNTYKLHGYGDGTFRAEQNITRAEVVTIVNRLLDRTADKAYIADNLRKLNTFSDMETNHWAYYDVMESANAHTALYDNGESWQK